MAEESGQDSELARLGAIGQSRLRRLINRQQDRLTQKETVEKAEQAAAQAALAAQSASWSAFYQGSYMWPMAGLVVLVNFCLMMKMVGGQIAQLFPKQVFV